MPLFSYCMPLFVHLTPPNIYLTSLFNNFSKIKGQRCLLMAINCISAGAATTGSSYNDILLNPHGSLGNAYRGHHLTQTAEMHFPSDKG